MQLLQSFVLSEVVKTSNMMPTYVPHPTIKVGSSLVRMVGETNRGSNDVEGAQPIVEDGQSCVLCSSTHFHI